MYTKDTSGVPELYFRPQSDGIVFRATSAGNIAPALRLRAFAIFDLEGNILMDQEGNSLSSNVSEIQIPNPLVNGKNVRDDWIVKFETAMPDTNYFWCISAFYGPFGAAGDDNLITSTVPYQFGTYADAIKTTQIRVMTKNVNGLSTASQRLTKIVHVQIYTVA